VLSEHHLSLVGSVVSSGAERGALDVRLVTLRLIAGAIIDHYNLDR
jgi:hypothetical protein